MRQTTATTATTASFRSRSASTTSAATANKHISYFSRTIQHPECAIVTKRVNPIRCTRPRVLGNNSTICNYRISAATSSSQ
jgi:hypothetical protein